MATQRLLSYAPRTRYTTIVRTTRHASARHFARELRSRLQRGYALTACGWERHRFVAHWSFGTIDRDLATD